MSLRENFQTEMKAAMRSKNSAALGTMRLILAALKDRDIAARQKGNNDGIADDEILAMLQSMIKQRKESVKAFSEAGRDELAKSESAEIAVIEQFLPEMMSDEEVQSAIKDAISEVSAASIRDMGKVMGILRGRYAGKMDFGSAAEAIKQALSE